MKEGLTIRFLYNTILGRFILKLLVNPVISRASARYLSSSLSKCMVPIFVHKNKIDLSLYAIPEGGYRSFNDFFIRDRKEQFTLSGKEEMIVPCDGLLTMAAIDEDSVFNIKHTTYSLSELLDNVELAKEYQGGTAFVYRMTPAHYHRYVWTATGLICDKRRIDGLLHSVKPICHNKVKVFVQNSREYVVVKKTPIGDIIQMEIGALLVGKITNYNNRKAQMVVAGQKKGYFEFGGSTIVVITKHKVPLVPEILHRELVGDEIPVQCGERLI